MCKFHATAGICQATNWMEQFLTLSVKIIIHGHSFWGSGLLDIFFFVYAPKIRNIAFPLNFGLAITGHWALIFPTKVDWLILCDFSFDSDRDTCNKSIHDVNPSQQKSKANRSAILAMSVVVPVMAIVVLVLACLIWRQKRKNNSEYSLHAFVKLFWILLIYYLIGFIQYL